MHMSSALVSMFTFMKRKAEQGSDKDVCVRTCNVCVRTCNLWDLGVSGNRIFEMRWKTLR